jgi:hypothetical protein
MNNQAHNYVVGITAFLPASHEADLGTVEAQMGQANFFKQLPKGLAWHNRRAKVEMAPSDKLLEQGRTLWRRQGRGKGVLLSFCAQPDDKPVEIDLARYMQVGLAKRTTLSSRNLKGGAYPIRIVGERFHNLPLLSLCDAWLRWRGIGSYSQAQTGADTGDSYMQPFAKIGNTTSQRRTTRL